MTRTKAESRNMSKNTRNRKRRMEEGSKELHGGKGEKEEQKDEV